MGKWGGWSRAATLRAPGSPVPTKLSISPQTRPESRRQQGKTHSHLHGLTWASLGSKSLNNTCREPREYEVLGRPPGGTGWAYVLGCRTSRKDKC